jgi:hypothetical protein
MRARVCPGRCVFVDRVDPFAVLRAPSVVQEHVVHRCGDLSEQARQAEPDRQLPQQFPAQGVGGCRALASHEPGLLNTLEWLMQLSCEMLESSRAALPDMGASKLRRRRVTKSARRGDPSDTSERARLSANSGPAHR